MSRSTNPEAGATAGFTLIETLVALGVMAAGLAAIGALANSSLRAGLYTERRLAEIDSARKIMAGLPKRDALPFGRSDRLPRRARMADRFRARRFDRRRPPGACGRRRASPCWSDPRPAR